jgi:GNAT superfamily N-acetyltransferase
VCKLLEEWLTSSEIDLAPPIAEDINEWVEGIMSSGRVLVAEKGGRLVGCSGVIVTQTPWNKSHEFMQSAFFYVAKAHRKTGVGRAMSEAIRAVAAAWGKPLILSIIGGSNDQKTTEIYYKADGLLYAGGTFTAGFALKSAMITN